ncbi:MAG: hypothetical protein R3B33_09550 [Nitrospirales bacterium]
MSICLAHPDDNQSKGNDIIRKIVNIYRNDGFSTQVLRAGIRSPNDVLQAALAGGHICAMRFAMFRQLFDPVS